LSAFFRDAKKGSHPDCVRSAQMSPKLFNEFMRLNEAMGENCAPRTGFYWTAISDNHSRPCFCLTPLKI
jgi:hypothetical protein